MEYCIIPVTDLLQNCSVVWCKNTRFAAIIDPGGEEEKIKLNVKKLNVSVKKILITHGHFDHIFAASSLSSYYNVPIFGPHEEEKKILYFFPKQCKNFNINFNSLFKGNIWLHDGDIIKIGSLTFIVIHCPGHSPGHVIFLNKEKKFIFMGDVLFNGSIGRTDLPGGDMYLLKKSIQNRILTLDDDIFFLPGHGSISSIGNERKNNPFLKKKKI